MASSGQLDVGKLASDLGVGGGGKGLDLGEIAKSIAGGGAGASGVMAALGQQSGGLGKLLGGAGGLAAGGAALAAGAGLLAGKGGGGNLMSSLGGILGGGGGGGGNPLGAILGGGGGAAENPLGAMLGGSETDAADPNAAAHSAMAQQLPAPTLEELSEGMELLARWQGDEWRTAKIGWIDGGQARVTFDSGLERWCELQELRVPQSLPTAPQVAPPPMPNSPPPPPPMSSGLPPVGTRVQAEVGDNLWSPADVLELDEAGSRIRIRFDNAYECWMDSKKIVLGF